MSLQAALLCILKGLDNGDRWTAEWLVVAEALLQGTQDQEVVRLARDIVQRSR